MIDKTNDTKPIIVVSRCLGFDNCRYNGEGEKNEFITKLSKYTDIITVCPEVSCGLTTPREPIRIVEINNKLELIQPKTNRNITSEMLDFCSEFIKDNMKVDGIILKCKSPSCGISDAKVYTTIGKGTSSRRTKGFFAKEITEKFPNSPCEDEGRLTNYKIRDHFLTRIFMLSKFRSIKENLDFKRLEEFHNNNNLLFAAYNQNYTRILDSIIHGEHTANIAEVFNSYEINLNRLLMRSPKFTSNIVVLLKAINTFSNRVSKKEMEFIWNTVDKYKKGTVPFSVPLYLVKGYLIRFELENLLNQSLFTPYPEDLILVNDSGKMIH